MMKSLLAISTFFFIFQMLSAQEFEGFIKYQIDIEVMDGSASQDFFEEMIGTIQYYYYKDGKYRIVSNGHTGEIIYFPDDNVRYSYEPYPNIYKTQDCSFYDQYIYEQYASETKPTILGRQCKGYVITTEDSKIIYYYDPKIEIYPERFRDHQLDFWDLITSETQSIPLQTIYFYDNVTITMTAVDIVENRVPDDAFMLRSGVAIDIGAGVDDFVGIQSEMSDLDDYGAVNEGYKIEEKGDLPSFGPLDFKEIAIEERFVVNLPARMQKADDPRILMSVYEMPNSDLEAFFLIDPNPRYKFDAYCTARLQRLYGQLADDGKKPVLSEDKEISTNGFFGNMATISADDLKGSKEYYSLLIIENGREYWIIQSFAHQASFADFEEMVIEMIESLHRY